MSEATIHRVASAPGRPYSRAVRAGNLVYTAGFTGTDEEGNAPDDFAAQCELIFKKAASALAAAGSSMKHVLAVHVYVTDPGDYALLNEPFAKVFAGHLPVRSCVVVKGFNTPEKRVEMQFTAVAADGP